MIGKHISKQPMYTESEKRKVNIYKDINKKELIDVGTFHCFGTNYQEFESGPGMYTTAIVEKDDGTVINIDVEYIKFI